MKRVKIMVIILAMTLMIGISAMQPPLAQELTITDIEPADEAYLPVQWVVEHGYMETSGAFNPTGYVTRNEFAGIVLRLGGQDIKLLNPGKPSFLDVMKEDPFYRQVEIAKSFFIAYKNSQGTYFRPYRYMTREEALMAVIKAFGYDSDNAPGIDPGTNMKLKDIIADLDKADKSLEKYIAIGIANELIDLRYSGGKLFFDPKRYITRGDLAVLIYNAYQKKALAQVKQPTWESTRVSWLPVEHAVKYEVKLYKGDDLVQTQTVTDGSNSFDFIKIIGVDPSSYKATVQAKAANSYLDGPVSEPVAAKFSPDDFRLKDGEGISIVTDEKKETHTIIVDASKLPARLPKTFRLCVVRIDTLPEHTVLELAASHKYHKLAGMEFKGRTGEYMRFEDDHRKYTVVLLLDNDLDYLGYYSYENPLMK